MALVVVFCSVAAAQPTKLDSNDVTWLWPVPTDIGAVDSLLSLDKLLGADGNPAWTKEAFDAFIRIAESDSEIKDSDGENRRISFPSGIREQKVWKVAGLRIDPSAPGADKELQKVRGETPQIRLIVQPVTTQGGRVVVHDFAAHLVYSFNADADSANPTLKSPDKAAFKRIVEDLLALKNKCSDKGVQTTGAKLSVHPGLKENAVPDLTKSVGEFLSKHIQDSRLGAMAVMGLEFPEPWIFVGMLRGADKKFIALPKAVFPPIMLSRRTGRLQVVPTPANRNTNPAMKQGVSTATLFESPFDLEAFAVVSRDAAGMPIRHTQIKNKDIPDFIANPSLSHFFNTDCLSCHTESQRRAILRTPASSQAFKWPDDVSQLDDSIAQKQAWNVRNIGWFPDFFAGNKASATISQRTATETAETVIYINKEYLGR